MIALSDLSGQQRCRNNLSEVEACRLLLLYLMINDATFLNLTPIRGLLIRHLRAVVCRRCAREIRQPRTHKEDVIIVRAAIAKMAIPAHRSNATILAGYWQFGGEYDQRTFERLMWDVTWRVSICQVTSHVRGCNLTSGGAYLRCDYPLPRQLP